MTTLGGSAKLYQAYNKFKPALATALEPVINQAQGLIARSAVSADGTIPQSQQANMLRDVGNLVQRFFVGPDYRQAYAPDGVTPLADYPKLLNYWIAWATYQAILPHSKYMQRNLPADVQSWLRTRMSRELITTSNPLAQYSPPHFWVDPRGYRLSDRIWQNSIQTRVRIDGLLLEAIRTGQGALRLSRDLEQFLLPTRAALRTSRPYGQDASFDAMRLARTEIGRAHTQASYVAGLANPYVESFDWALSASHPKFDICDRLATIGMDRQRLKDPYPATGAVPKPFDDSHPQCLCTLLPGPLAPTADVVRDLRAMMGKGEPAPITPIDAWPFLRMLLGAYLASLVFGEVEV